MRDVLLTGALLGLVTLTAPAAGQTGLTLRDDGIEFPDGSLQTTAAGAYANVIIVAKSGGHYTSIQSALDAIGVELPAATEENPYLVWVAPGVYEEQVTMEEWVDIQGSGEGITRITKISSDSDMDPTVEGADNAELRFLTVENTGGHIFEITAAISNDGASPILTHVTAHASGGFYNYGVFNRNSSSPTMTDVIAAGSGGNLAVGIRNLLLSSPAMTSVRAAGWAAENNCGVYNELSSPRMTNVRASASGGSFATAIRNDSSYPTMTSVTAIASSASVSNKGVKNEDFSHSTIRGSHLEGADAAIQLVDVNSSADVAHSVLDGGTDGPGTFTCFSVCNQALQALESDCQLPGKD